MLTLKRRSSKERIVVITLSSEWSWSFGVVFVLTRIRKEKF
jgi:hypothetical protein